YMVSLSVICQVLFLPILGAIADTSNRKKQMMGLFAYIGSLATAAMYFLEGQRYVLGGFLFVLANLGFGASVVFYNAFFPDVPTEEERDAVSSKGWAFGYVGGALLLALNLVLYAKREAFGLSSGMAVRL